MKGRVRWGAVLNAVAGIIGIAEAAQVAGLLSPKVGAFVAVLALTNATFIKPAIRQESERRPRG